MIFTHSGDIANIPTHLDKNFFNDVLENVLLMNTFEIKRINFKMGSNTGENYCSEIYRVEIFYKLTNETRNDRCVSVIIKNIQHTDATDFLWDLNVFYKEKIFYSYVLPQLEVLSKENIKFAPRLYHTLKRPTNTLVFEDLAESKYEMASREKGLDITHSLLVMKKMGKFHAISIRLFKKEPELKKCFQWSLFSETALKKDDGMVVKFFSSNINALIDLIENWPGYEKITEKVKRYANNLKDNLRRSAVVDDSKFCVLNHGDLWVNNILFQYDEQRKPINLNLIDFQMSFWNSPGIDLNYFFYTSIELDILKNSLELLIREYHRSLSETMKELGLTQIPTYQDIYNEVQKKQLYGFFANYGIFPLICQDKEQSHDSNLENFNDEEFAKQKLRKLFASKRLETTFRYTLDKFNKLGIFD